MKSTGLALDIDDTIAHTGYDWFQQLTETFGDCGMTFEEAMELHHGRNNSIWTSPEAQKWMHDKLHDNQYRTTIPLSPYAYQSVIDIHAKTPFVCYLTARPENVLEGTQQRLKQNNFPDLPVIAKPLSTPIEKEHLRKAEQLYNLYQEGVTGIIDDQLKLIHQMEEYYPDYPGTIHIIGQKKIIQSRINHTISDSRATLTKKLEY